MYVEPRLRDLTSNLDVVLSRYAEYRSRGLVPKREVVEQIAARLVAVGWTKAAVEMAADFIGMGELNELSEDAWLGLIRGICRKKHVSSLLLLASPTLLTFCVRYRTRRLLWRVSGM